MEGRRRSSRSLVSSSKRIDINRLAAPGFFGGISGLDGRDT
jgi:hypothetical protein